MTLCGYLTVLYEILCFKFHPPGLVMVEIVLVVSQEKVESVLVSCLPDNIKMASDIKCKRLRCLE